jgi:hypothetical protein
LHTSEYHSFGTSLQLITCQTAGTDVELRCSTFEQQTVAKRITDRLDESLKPEVIKWAANYDHRLKLGNKPIYHLEAFVAKVMFIQVCQPSLPRKALYADDNALHTTEKLPRGIHGLISLPIWCRSVIVVSNSMQNSKEMARKEIRKSHFLQAVSIQLVLRSSILITRYIRSFFCCSSPASLIAQVKAYVSRACS